MADLELIRALGQSVSQLIFQLSLTSIFFGCYVVVIGIAIRLTLAKGIHNTRSRIMILTMIFMFTLTITYYAILHATIIMFVRDNMIEHPPANAASIGTMNLDLDSAAVVFSIINLAIGDVVVLWRSWAVSPHSRSLRWISSISFVLTCLLFICTLSLKILTNYRIFNDIGVGSVVFLREVRAQQNSWAASIALSLFTNIVATAFVGIRAWEYKQFQIKNKLHSSSSASSIILLMFESGLLYCVIQMTYLLLQFVPNRTLPFLIDGKGVIFYILTVVTSLYPTLILLIVSMERSFSNKAVHIPSQSPGDVESPLGKVGDMEKQQLSTMRFGASVPHSSTTDNMDSSLDSKNQ